MFTQKELKHIDKSYFRVLTAGCYGVTLQSRNTRHCWYIASEEHGRYRSCRIYHTHHKGTAMHEHGHGRTLGSCMEQIKSHDVYQLKKDASKRQRIRSRMTHRTVTETDSLSTTF